MDERLAVGTTQQEVGRQAASSGINKRKCTHSLTQSSEDEGGGGGEGRRLPCLNRELQTAPTLFACNNTFFCRCKYTYSYTLLLGMGLRPIAGSQWP